MKNQIIQLEEKGWQVFAFTDEKIILSTRAHTNMVTLTQSSIESGRMEKVLNIPLSSLNAVEFNEKDNTIKIAFSEDGAIKKETLTLNTPSQRNAIAEELSSIRGLKEEVVEESKIKPLLFNLVGIGLIIFLTWVFRGMALDALNGEHYEASGRRAGKKQLIATIVESLGPNGVLVVGVLALAIMIYITYRRFSNPAAEYKYH
ncbi:MAG: hypothetical protein KDC49_23115 [Saprospiraceae bacterium]|nr:hypothetical protein [Saprospiraceae bacterium]